MAVQWKWERILELQDEVKNRGRVMHGPVSIKAPFTSRKRDASLHVRHPDGESTSIGRHDPSISPLDGVTTSKAVMWPLFRPSINATSNQGSLLEIESRAQVVPA